VSVWPNVPPENVWPRRAAAGLDFFLLLLSHRGRPLSAVFQRLPSPVGSLHNRERNYAISDGKITMFSLNNSKYCFNRRLINYVNNKV
jgi:hypothetical protein